MPQPYNYSGGFAPQRPVNLMDKVLKFRQASQQQEVYNRKIAQDDQRIVAEKAQQAKAIQYQADTESLTPESSIEDIRAVIMKYPKLASGYTKILSGIESKHQKGLISNLIPIKEALESGSENASMIAGGLTKKAADAYRERFPKQAEQMEGLMGMIDANDGTALSTIKGLMAVADPEIIKSYESLANVAETEQKVIDAKAKAKNASSAYDLNTQTKTTLLAKSSKEQALAKSKVEMKRFENELKDYDDSAKGWTPVKQKQGMIDKFRGEYKKSAEPFIKRQAAYQTLINTEDTGAGDLALIFSYMKILDPGVSVMEGDVVNVKNATGKMRKTMNLYNSAITGQAFGSDAERQEFRDQAKLFMDTATTVNEATKKGYTDILKRRNFTDDEISGVFSTVKEFEDTQKPSVPGVTIIKTGEDAGKSEVINKLGQKVVFKNEKDAKIYADAVNKGGQ